MRPALRFVVLLSFFAALAAPSEARRSYNPDKYGTLTISNFSRAAGMPPVRFDHWLHRAKFTCRLCHIDIAFTMKANASGISAATNIKGYYCGTCHNGVWTYEGKKVFASCSLSTPQNGDRATCERCHSVGIDGKREYTYASFSEKFPKYVLDGFINWEEAEAKKLIRPADYLEGISLPRKRLAAQQDFFITSKSTWMPDIIFSHKKHAFWNGCEVCHPDIFPSTKKGTVKYSMLEIANGQYCGLCHGSVAFTLNDCYRCHKDQVQ